MSINWTNQSFRLLHHEDIIEYDIKSANTSLMSYYGLASEKEIRKIVNMKKDEREVAVGKMMRKSQEFSAKLEKAFTDIIEEFIATNHLDREEDIVSIKKDAIFVRNRSIRKTTFGDSVIFRPKGHYSGFLQLPTGRLEFYYRQGKRLDVKGISDELLCLHENGVLDFLNTVFEETSNWIDLQKYLKDYAKAYKERELPYDAYREFNMNSKFLVHMMGQDLLLDSIDEPMLAYLDISYNYINIFMNVLKVVVGR